MVGTTGILRQAWTNEIPGREIDAKMDMPPDTDFPLLASQLTDALHEPQGNFSRVVGDALTLSERKVCKYKDRRGSFSVKVREDGTSHLKRKTNKSRHGGNVSMNDVEKMECGEELAPSIIANATFIASFIRRKMRFHVLHDQTRRVYSIDLTDCTANKGKIAEMLRQVEIEYQGLSGVSTYVAPQAQLLHALIQETHEISETVYGLLLGLGYQPIKTIRTKGRWLDGK